MPHAGSAPTLRSRADSGPSPSVTLCADCCQIWLNVGGDFPTNFGSWPLFFIDDDTGYAAGIQQGGSPLPRLYRTTNGGASWTAVPTPQPSAFIRGMHWWDIDTGVAALGHEGVYRTSDGGATWTHRTTLPAWSLDFRGDLGLGTANFSWEPPIYTEDAGLNWQLADLPMDAPASGVLATELGFIVGGQGSAILRLADPAVSGIEDDLAEEGGGTGGGGPGGGPGGGGDGPDGGGGPNGGDGPDGGGGPNGGDTRSGDPGIVTLRRTSQHPAPGPVHFELALTTPGVIQVEVFGPDGRRTREFANGFRSAGTFPMEWDGRNSDGRVSPAGLYLVRARGESGEHVMRVVRID